jgi:hypothetical protein
MLFSLTFELVATVKPSDQYNRIMGMLVACGRHLGGRDYALDGKLFRCFPEKIEIYTI